MSPVAEMETANRSERFSWSYQTSKCLLSAVQSLTETTDAFIMFTVYGAYGHLMK